MTDQEWHDDFQQRLAHAIVPFIAEMLKMSASGSITSMGFGKKGEQCGRFCLATGAQAIELAEMVYLKCISMKKEAELLGHGVIGGRIEHDS